MECKGSYITAILSTVGGINRNIVECKDQEKQQIHLFREVLIETLWNVKTCKDFKSSVVQAVLIETLWNVKNSRQSQKP